MAQLILEVPASGFRANDMQLFQNVNRLVWNPARRRLASKDQSSGTGFGDQLGFEPLPEAVFLGPGLPGCFCQSALIELPQGRIDITEGRKMLLRDFRRLFRQLPEEAEAHYLKLHRFDKLLDQVRAGWFTRGGTSFLHHRPVG